MTRRTRLLMQLAAVVALVTLLGLLLIAVSVVAENPDELVIAFVFLLVVASSGWLVLTSRGLRLLIGLTAFSLGLVALVLQLSVDGFLLIGLLIAAVAIFGTTARFAVGRDRRTLHATHLASRAPPARRGVLIINPTQEVGRLSASTWRMKRGNAESSPCAMSPVTISVSWPRTRSARASPAPAPQHSAGPEAASSERGGWRVADLQKESSRPCAPG
jgi:hypothetical protein